MGGPWQDLERYPVRDTTVSPDRAEITTAATALDVVSQVARELAVAPDMGRAVEGTVRAISAAPFFEGCAFQRWHDGAPDGLATAVGVVPAHDDVLRALAAPSGRARLAEQQGAHALVAPVHASLGPASGDDQPSGLLIARWAGDGDSTIAVGEASALLATVADMLAPFIAADRRRERLEGELAWRVRQVSDQRRFTERIIDTLPVGLYVIDRDYRIEVWNRKRETGFQGISREEAVGRTIFEILHRQPAEMLRQEFDDAFLTGEVQQFSMESSSTGELRFYRITKIPMRDDTGEITHVITLGEDVTEWREAQERFAQAEKLAAIGQLAAGVMHEINNPLATIAACAESLSLGLGDAARNGDSVPAESGEYLRIVESEVQRCKRIVDRLLEFSRPRPLVPEPVDVNAVVEQTLFLLKHHTRFKRYTVQVELDSSAPVTRGNSEQLVQVLMALLINAMDSMGEDGVIELRTSRAAGTRELAIVEVRDHGEGIPRAHLAKIFEPFYTTKLPGRGTGLGLSICYGIVAEHGGRIEVESELGEGSIFRVELPGDDAPRPVVAGE